jgi:uncharacterized protein YqeY
MATLKEQVEKRFKEAMSTRNDAELSLFRMIKSSVKNKEIEVGHELDDAEMTAILEKEAKQRRDSIEQYKSGNRQDLAKHEEDELNIIESFLPEKMSEEEIREIVKQEISKLGAKDLGEFGKVMGAVMGELKGKADGALVQKMVREEMGA